MIFRCPKCKKWLKGDEVKVADLKNANFFSIVSSKYELYCSSCDISLELENRIDLLKWFLLSIVLVFLVAKLYEAPMIYPTSVVLVLLIVGIMRIIRVKIKNPYNKELNSHRLKAGG